MCGLGTAVTEIQRRKTCVVAQCVPMVHTVAYIFSAYVPMRCGCVCVSGPASTRNLSLPEPGAGVTW